jgi:hypothetical protein
MATFGTTGIMRLLIGLRVRIRLLQICGVPNLSEVSGTSTSGISCMIAALFEIF